MSLKYGKTISNSNYRESRYSAIRTVGATVATMAAPKKFVLEQKKAEKAAKKAAETEAKAAAKAEKEALEA
jgi:hypothetical protein